MRFWKESRSGRKTVTEPEAEWAAVPATEADSDLDLAEVKVKVRVRAADAAWAAEPARVRVKAKVIATEVANRNELIDYMNVVSQSRRLIPSAFPM